MAARFPNQCSTNTFPSFAIRCPLRAPPPNTQSPQFQQVGMTHKPEEQFSLNYDVSDQKICTTTISDKKILLPAPMHGNIKYHLETTPPPSSMPQDEDDFIFSDKIPHKLLKDHNYEIPVKDDRGIGAIFVNETFRDRNKRPGVKKDIDNLDKIFTMMSLKVSIYKDKTNKEMLAELKRLAGEVKYKHYVLCVAFSTHGDQNDTLFGIDGGEGGGLSLRSQILPIFNPENCPILEGKPKIFIIQACRGDKKDYLTGKIYSDAIEKDQIVSLQSDFLISYACAPDYMAYRTEREGAWFLNELNKIYTEYSEIHHFMDILTLTNQSLLLRCKERDQSKLAQPSHIESTLKKFLWLRSGSYVSCLESDLPSRSEIVLNTGPLALEPGSPEEHVPFFAEPTPIGPNHMLTGPIGTDVINQTQVYDWHNKNICIGNIIHDNDKQYLKYDGAILRPQFDCLPSYDLTGDTYTGLGVIIVNYKCGSTERVGAHKDLENFKHIFEVLKLKIVIKENINCMKKGDELGMKEFIENEMKENAKLKSIFIAISTHGAGLNKLACFDGMDIEISTILNTLQDVNLSGKPKVLFIQACRGENMDSQIVSDALPKVATRQTDLLVAYSCVEGYKAWRDKENGSWFVTSLRECFDVMHGRTNILDLLTATSNYMLKNFKNDTECLKNIKQPPEVKHTLCAQLFI